MAYCLDSNTFIEAKNRYYGFDFCPAYWDWLDQEAASGQLLCVRSIYDEIAEGKDDLATWIKARSDGDWLRRIDAEDTQKAFKDVVATWSPGVATTPARRLRPLWDAAIRGLLLIVSPITIRS